MQVISADQAAALISDEWTITIAGFAQCCGPESILEAMERRFESTGHPRDLSLIFGSACGDGVSQGLNRLARPGLVKQGIGNQWTCAPRLGDLAADHAIRLETWPLSVIGGWYQSLAEGRSQVLSEAGLGTFIDPQAQDPGAASDPHRPQVMRQLGLDRPTLSYRSEPVRVALLRGTRSDPHGNISMEREVGLHDHLAQAQAVRSCGGVVIVQVLEITHHDALDPRAVHLPAHLVDYVVRADPKLHRQTYGVSYSPTLSGEWHGAAGFPSGPQQGGPSHTEGLDEVWRVITRRAALEVLEATQASDRRRPLLLHAGAGLRERVPRELHQGHRYNDPRFTWTLESGVVGGMPIGGSSSGASADPTSFLQASVPLRRGGGRGVDMALLGFGAIDRRGRVDVAHPNEAFLGVGSLIDTAPQADRLVLLGTFSTGGHPRFVERVTRLCLDAVRGASDARPLVITELGVFRLDSGELILIEVAPGVDVQADIVARSGCPIRTIDAPRPMPAQVFGHETIDWPFVT